MIWMFSFVVKIIKLYYVIILTSILQIFLCHYRM